MVWPTCGSRVTRRDILNNAQTSTLDTNPNPSPNPDPDRPQSTHINFVSQKSGVFLLKKMLDDTNSNVLRSNIFSLIPYFILDNISDVR